MRRRHEGRGKSPLAMILIGTVAAIAIYAVVQNIPEMRRYYRMERM